MENKENNVDEVKNQKKKLPIIVILLAILLIVSNGILIFCLVNKDDTPAVSVTCNASRFKDEYEALNDKTYSGSERKYLSVSIPEDNPIEYVDYTRVKQILTNGTGVIYFGFPECPWCRNLVPTLIDVSNELGIEKIYYFNNKSERDVKSLDENNNIVVKTDGSDNYYELLELLGEHASIYDGLNDDSIKRLYFPTLIFVKDGEIVAFHEGTVDSQEDASVMMTAEQQKELKKLLKEYFGKVYSLKCSMDSAC